MKKRKTCEAKKVFVPTAAERWLFLADSIGGFYEEEENGKTVFICCNIFSTYLFIHVGFEKNSFNLTRSYHVVVKWRLLWSMMSSAYDCRRGNKWGNNWTNSAALGCVYRLMKRKKYVHVKNCEEFSTGNHSSVKCLIHHHICCPFS